MFQKSKGASMIEHLASYSIVDVFTPSRPARLTFVERTNVNDKLVNALKTPGKQIIVYGHSGSGKTTLLNNKLNQLYEDHLTTRCISHMTFEHIVLDAFDQLNPYYSSEKQITKTRSIKASVKNEYFVLKTQVEAYTTAQAKESVKRYIPPQLTPQTLAKLLGSANLCWVLEDFHKLPTDEKKKLAQSMKVFMDMADSYPELKIVAIGAVDTARQVIDYDQELTNRVAEIHVPLMSEDEIRSIISKGEELLNFSIPSDVCNGIVTYTNGLASVCHNLCLNICYAAGITERLPEMMEVSDAELSKALEQYIAEASDTLKSTFDKALMRQREKKYDNCRLIIRALSECSHEGATHAAILQRIRKAVPEYPSGNLTTYLKELQSNERGAVLRYDPNARRFSFSDPIFRSFSLVLFKDGTKTGKKRAKTEAEILSDTEAKLKKVIELLLNEFKKTEIKVKL